ncbi:hypothetical protein FKM82_014970 [Ascaphus truei]
MMRCYDQLFGRFSGKNTNNITIQGDNKVTVFTDKYFILLITFNSYKVFLKMYTLYKIKMSYIYVHETF